MQRIGRYVIGRPLGTGGMAAVHVGRLLAHEGVSRTVAVKRLHRHLADQTDFLAMFLDEARLAAQVRHANVVQLYDFLQEDGELLMILEYVQGESLSGLIARARERGETVPERIIAALLIGTLEGLHAAHEACNEQGTALKIIHRDVSPHNVLVGVDGVPRLSDFGIAKALDRVQTTREGNVKGKLSYMPPEQLMQGGEVDRRADVYAAGVILWELLCNRRRHEGMSEAQLIVRVLAGVLELPSEVGAEVSADWDPIVSTALAIAPEGRYATAQAFSQAIAQLMAPASKTEVGAWVARLAADTLAERKAAVEALSSPAAIAAPAAAPTGAPETTATTAPSATPVIESAISAPVDIASSSPLRSWLPPVLLGALLAVGVALFALRAPANGGAASASVPAPEDAAGRVVEVVASAPASASVVPTASSAIAPPASASVVVPLAGSRPAAAPAVKRLGCAQNKFYTDADGIKRVRRECL